MPPISPERWRALSPYLDEALEIPPDRRAAWLSAISTRDAELGADLRTLLAEQEAVHQERFLDNAVLDARATVAPSLAGQVLGAYKLISPVGQGGSGSVWLAERCDGRFQGRAAVKVLNLALVARAGEERFKREGTILARLRHPRIAQLIDAGVSPAGLPYLVLEYVDGQPIDHYCDERALGIEARIRLFLDVLDAVAFAHAGLTVHRDIKPANVLVSTDGQVKLLDFGIARLLEPTDEWGTMVAVKSGPITREVGRALTPEFAAPEQVSGGAVTTATDVYALGVLLYLLLTGQHPAGRAVDSPITLVRAIVETEPPRVSDAVVSRTETEAALARHAARCGTSISRLRRSLRGDLDTIVAKALKKNTAERYASVAALADDLRRYLRNEPISARPDTLRYRTRTFVRRHRGIVAMAAAAVLLVAAMTAVHTVRLSAERDRAQREAAKAIKVSELLMGLLTRADPFATRTAAEPSVRHLLDSGAEQVQTELAGEPELQSEMLTMIGRTYRRLGVYDRAQPLLEQALVSGQQAFGAEHERIAETLHDLGVVLADRGEYAGAGRHLEQALAMRRKLLGEHPAVAVTLAELGRAYQDQGLNGRAEPLQREALELRRKLLGERDPETAVSLSDLGSVLRLNGDLSGAETLLRQCLDINRSARGEEHPNTATTMHDLALITAGRGDHRAAEWQLRYVLALQRKTLGEAHPIVATSLNNLARVLVASRRYDEAATLLQEALDIVRPRLGSRHQLVAIYTINAGAVQLARRQPAIAEALLREGLRIRAQAPGVVPGRRRTFPEDDWSPGATKSLLGAALIAQARYDEAEAVLLEARGELEAMAPGRDQDVKTTIGRLVELYRAWGKPDKAAAYRALLSP